MKQHQRTLRVVLNQSSFDSAVKAAFTKERTLKKPQKVFVFVNQALFDKKAEFKRDPLICLLEKNLRLLKAAGKSKFS